MLRESLGSGDAPREIPVQTPVVSGRSWLCPNRETLDRYLGHLLNAINPQSLRFIDARQREKKRCGICANRLMSN